MRRRVNRGRTAKPDIVPAPIGGLNRREGLANMAAIDAYEMVNHFPGNTTVNTRLGNELWSYWFANQSPVQSLFAGNYGVQSVIYGCIAGNVMAMGGAGITQGTDISGNMPRISGLTSSVINTAQFSNAGVNTVICVTGSDQPFHIPGAVAAAAGLTITGTTGSPNGLDCVLAFKGRLFFSTDSLLGFYYLAVGAIQGAASYFDLAQVSLKGGHVVGMSTFSQNSGSGFHDYAVFMTSRGEYIVYEGFNPASASDWSLVGRYFAPRPIGRKGWFRFRSDLYVICEEGILSIAQIMANGANGNNMEYISSKLGNVVDDYKQNQNVLGWCGVLDPSSNQLIINIPTGSTVSEPYVQFVMNTDTNAWCQFEGWNAVSWCEWDGGNGYGSGVFFGTDDGRVMWANKGYDDDGAVIEGRTKQAFNYTDDGYGSGSADKHYHFTSFIIEVTQDDMDVETGLGVNFVSDTFEEYGTVSAQAEPQTIAVPTDRLGYAASVQLGTSGAGQLEWYATRVLYEKSKGLVVL